MGHGRLVWRELRGGVGRGIPSVSIGIVVPEACRYDILVLVAFDIFRREIDRRPRRHQALSRITLIMPLTQLERQENVAHARSGVIPQGLSSSV